MMTRWLALAALVALVATVSACGDDDDFFTTEQLMDPESCKDCHPKHYKEWASSMHAYAADDPVFVAMNRRGQEETNGDLGSFCVGCHAPMAVRTGATTDGLDLEELPQHLKGVTCYFCHTVQEVAGEHTNPLVLATDDVMRGALSDPVDNGVHKMSYSALHDSRSLESSNLCGACHDIVTPAGVHLERTFLEWKDSVFHKPQSEGGLSCGNCHMEVQRGVVADFPGVPLRDTREHLWPGVDVALTPWPDIDAQVSGIERDLFGAVLPKLCVQPGPGGVDIEYNLDNVFAGHMLPSGASQDRRMWAEVTVYRGDVIVLQTGLVPDGTAVATVAETDTSLWQMRDYLTDANGDEAHMFWDVAAVDSQLLPPGVTNDMTDPRFTHSVSRFFNVLGTPPDRVTARLHVRPMGLEVLDDLIDSGHLDATFRDGIRTFTLDGSSLEWTLADDGFGCIKPNG